MEKNSVMAEKIVHVALGDSTGVGVGAREGGGYVARIFRRVERERPGSRLINLCVSGATTADVLREQAGRVATFIRQTRGTNSGRRRCGPSWKRR